MGKSPQSSSGDRGSHAPPQSVRSKSPSSPARFAMNVRLVRLERRHRFLALMPITPVSRDGKIPARSRDNIGSEYALGQDQP